MILLYGSLWLSLFAPFGAVALALGLPGAILGGIGAATLGVLWMGIGGFSRTMEPGNAEALEEELEVRLMRLWAQQGPERVEPEFRVYRSTLAEMRVWVHSRRRVSVHFSRGFVEQMRDQDLRQAFRMLVDADLALLRVANRREALRTLFAEWKGDERTFRHWWLTFWLHPLERLLKIARI